MRVKETIKEWQGRKRELVAGFRERVESPAQAVRDGFRAIHRQTTPQKLLFVEKY